MPNGLDLSLDPTLESELGSHIDREIELGNFELSNGRVFVIDAASGIPGRASLFSALKDKLEPYVDFDSGDLKVVQFKYHGADAHFTVVPSWESSPADLRGKDQLRRAVDRAQFTLNW